MKKKIKAHGLKAKQRAKERQDRLFEIKRFYLQDLLRQLLDLYEKK
jgi:hypothetical protein